MVITAEASAKADPVLVQAVDLARAAAIEEAGEAAVGEYVGVDMDDDRVATHLFACASPAYVGWRWAITLTRASRARSATVNQVVLLPGPESILAPAWIPWSERVRPGDLGVGDVLPTSAEDARLVPGYTGANAAEAFADDWELRPALWELGLGRARVLSVQGRDDAAERWQRGRPGRMPRWRGRQPSPAVPAASSSPSVARSARRSGCARMRSALPMAGWWPCPSGVVRTRRWWPTNPRSTMLRWIRRPITPDRWRASAWLPRGVGARPGA